MNGLENWLETPPGFYARLWQQAQFDARVADIFGYHALQLGLPDCFDALAANRMPYRWQAALVAPQGCDVAPYHGKNLPPKRPSLVASPINLPFGQESLDLIVMPMALNYGFDPKAVIAEIDRVLVHEGHMVITGFNHRSLWGAMGALPRDGKSFNPKRLAKKMFHQTQLELLSIDFGGWGLAPRQMASNLELGLFSRLCSSAWPKSGSLWCATAVKRCYSAVLVGPAWKTLPAGANAKASVAQQTASPTSHHVSLDN